MYIMWGAGYGFAAAIQPGPFQTYLIAQALARGWRQTLAAALAPLVSDGPIIILMLWVLNRLPTWLERGLYVSGGVFILYLAWQMFRRRQNDASGTSLTPRAGPHSLAGAALMNILSPGAYVYWGLVAGPILLSGWRQDPLQGMGFLMGFYVAMLVTLGSLIILFGAAGRWGQRLNRTLRSIAALTLLGFGSYQLWRGLGR